MAIFYVDENVSFALNDLLNAYGHAVFTTRDEGHLGSTDDLQLLHAVHRGWVTLTHNRKDFVLLHNAWHRWSRAWGVESEHTGIVVIEPPVPARNVEAAALIDDLCKSYPLANTLYEWKRATGWIRNPRR